MVKPVVVIVDAANINERRKDEDKSFVLLEDNTRKLFKKPANRKNGRHQIWSYDHFEHCLHRLEENVPGAFIICFFDAYSVEVFDRSAWPDDKRRLIEAWSREDYKNGKIFKVPKEFKADHPLVELAQKLDAFVITGDRYDKPGDPSETQEWRKSEKVFYASFPDELQDWVFENQKVKDDKKRLRLSKHEVSGKSRLLKHENFGKSFATETELVEVLKFAENFLNEWLADPRNYHLRRYFDSENLKQNIPPFAVEYVAAVAEPEHIVRAYRILKVNPEFKKYQRKYVKVQGRLIEIGSGLYIEWFANYSPIRIEPVDENSFIEYRQSQNFVEVKGELNESSGHPVLKKASFVRNINFENLQTPIPKTESLTKSIPKNYTDKERLIQKPREEPRLPEVVVARPTRPPIPPPLLPTISKRGPLIDRKVLIGLFVVSTFVYLLFGESIANFFR
jgi:hypothetical protein